MRQYGESKTTRIMMATVPHVTSGWGLKFQADGFLFDRVHNKATDKRKVCDSCVDKQINSTRICHRIVAATSVGKSELISNLVISERYQSAAVSTASAERWVTVMTNTWTGRQQRHLSSGTALSTWHGHVNWGRLLTDGFCLNNWFRLRLFTCI